MLVNIVLREVFFPNMVGLSYLMTLYQLQRGTIWEDDCVM